MELLQKGISLLDPSFDLSDDFRDMKLSKEKKDEQANYTLEFLMAMNDGDLKLSPRDMFALDKKMEEQNNYFTCTICLKVVKDPRECGQCSNIFCFDCLADWNKLPNALRK